MKNKYLEKEKTRLYNEIMRYESSRPKSMFPSKRRSVECFLSRPKERDMSEIQFMIEMDFYLRLKELNAH